MNPFDLSGPEFLLIYAVVGVAVLAALGGTRMLREGEPLKVRLTDPYLIGCLRGGVPEALRLVVVSLVDRGLLERTGTKLWAPPGAPERVVHPLERAVLERFRRTSDATEIFADGGLAAAAAPLRETLERHGLLPDAALRAERWGRLLLALAVLHRRRRHQGHGGPRTRPYQRDLPDPAGDGLLRDGVRRGACASAPSAVRWRSRTCATCSTGCALARCSWRRGRADEALLLAAVFGLAVLPTPWAYAREFFPRAAASNNSGSRLVVVLRLELRQLLRLVLRRRRMRRRLRRMRQLSGPDRVGLGWRPELAAGVFAHAERIDVVEVIADDHFESSRAELRALRTLSAQVPVVLHGVSLGLASTEAVDERRLARVARVVARGRARVLVRAPGVRARRRRRDRPPGGAAAHGRDGRGHRAQRRAGARGGGHGAAARERGVARRPARATAARPTGSRTRPRRPTPTLLLDLHNLHANARNFGFDAIAFLGRFPVARVRAVHLSGGRWITARERRPPRCSTTTSTTFPDAVYALLVEVARRAPHPLTVILERDGEYPRMEVLLAELDRARERAAEGRSARVGVAAPARTRARGRKDAALPERALARLYVEPALRRRLGGGRGRRRARPLADASRRRAPWRASTAPTWSSPRRASRASARGAARQLTRRRGCVTVAA